MISVQLAGGGCTGNRRARSVAGIARGLAPDGAPTDRDCRGGSEVSDRVVALCHHGRPAGRRDSEDRVAGARRTRAVRTVRWGTAARRTETEKVSPPSCLARDCTVSGGRASARARIEAEAAGHWPVLTAGLACDRRNVGDQTRGLTPTHNIEATEPTEKTEVNHLSETAVTVRRWARASRAREWGWDSGTRKRPPLDPLVCPGIPPPLSSRAVGPAPAADRRAAAP